MKSRVDSLAMPDSVSRARLQERLVEALEAPRVSV